MQHTLDGFVSRGERRRLRDRYFALLRWVRAVLWKSGREGQKYVI